MVMIMIIFGANVVNLLGIEEKMIPKGCLKIIYDITGGS